MELIDYQGDKQNSEFKCLLCNNTYFTRWGNILDNGGWCPHCFGNSKPQREILDFISEICSYTCLSNQRTIIKHPLTNHIMELDIFIPEKNIAIEYNGLYWHSEQVIPDSYYHFLKHKVCKEKGIHLIQIFEDEWIFKKQIVKNMLLHKLGINTNRIHARKCSIKEISAKEKNEFLNKNHIQGGDSSNIKLGAFFNNELLSVMTFSNGNISKGGIPNDLHSWEISRFSTSKHIPGVAGKLLEYFKRNYKWNSIYTYADKRWSNGNMYKKIGFEYIYETKPNYWYIKDYKRIHRFNLRKRSDEPKDIPEWKLRQEQGYYRIWDCGNLKFQMINENFKKSVVP